MNTPVSVAAKKTQKYKTQAYTLGEKEGQARMNNSGRLLFQQGYAAALEAAIKTAKEKLWDCASCMSKEDVIKSLTSLKPKD